MLASPCLRAAATTTHQTASMQGTISLRIIRHSTQWLATPYVRCTDGPLAAMRDRPRTRHGTRWSCAEQHSKFSANITHQVRYEYVLFSSSAETSVNLGLKAVGGWRPLDVSWGVSVRCCGMSLGVFEPCLYRSPGTDLTVVRAVEYLSLYLACRSDPGGSQ